jgi:hypothetical protein
VGALSLTQPWAWLVIRPDVTEPDERRELFLTDEIKCIENRVWGTAVRGRFMVHASKMMLSRDYEAAFDTASQVSISLANKIPRKEHLQRGGIVGAAELYDVLAKTTRPHVPWHMRDQYGFRLRGQQPLPFLPCAGLQRWWGNFELRDGRAVQL